MACYSSFGFVNHYYVLLLPVREVTSLSTPALRCCILCWLQPTCADRDIFQGGNQAWSCPAGTLPNAAAALMGPATDALCCTVGGLVVTCMLVDCSCSVRFFAYGCCDSTLGDATSTCLLDALRLMFMCAVLEPTNTVCWLLSACCLLRAAYLHRRQRHRQWQPVLDVCAWHATQRSQCHVRAAK
jgi:hypothetical protein